MIERLAKAFSLDILRDFPCLGITGPRQIGKTSLAQIISETSERPAIYLDLESTEDIQKLENAETFLRNFEEEQVIIDEVQRMPSLFPLLRSLIDRNRRPGRFILLGSASPKLIRETSESLAGRIAYLELGGIQCREIGWAGQQDVWIRGGYPIPLTGNVNRSRWFENYLRSYVERDLPMLGLPAAPMLTNRLLYMLAHMQGSTINYSNLAKSLGISDKTVKTYIDFLEASYLIRQLPAFHTNTKKRLVKAPKVFFRDSGLFHYLQRIHTFEDALTHPLLGASWEGFVIEQIAQAIPTDYQLSFYRNHQGDELDLIIERGNKAVALIEIKYGDQILPSRSNQNAADDIGEMKKYLLHSKADGPAWENASGWLICGLEHFIEAEIGMIMKV